MKNQFIKIQFLLGKFYKLTKSFIYLVSYFRKFKDKLNSNRHIVVLKNLK
jgi:hypothetical protein